MVLTLSDINKLFKFSWAQAWSDQNGKSSGSAWSGWFLCVVGGIGFLYALFLKQADGMMYSLGFATLGAGLLGYNKKVNGKPEPMDIVGDNTTVETTKIEATTTQTTVTPPEQ